MKFLVIGMGSIGQRHAKNLKELGHEVVGFDIASNDDSTLLLSPRTRYDSWLICTPPDTHLYYMNMAIDKRIPMFVEKPITDKGVSAAYIKGRNSVRNLLIYPGHCLRHHSEVKFFYNNVVRNKSVGKVHGFRLEFGYDIRKWRKTHYKDSYNYQWGCLLDTVHEIDIAQWMFGKIEAVNCWHGMISDLELATKHVPSSVEMILEMQSGLIGSIHFDITQPYYHRYWRVWGEKGSEELALVPDHKMDEMYVAEMRNFIGCLEGKEEPVVSLEDAISAVEVVDQLC